MEEQVDDSDRNESRHVEPPKRKRRWSSKVGGPRPKKSHVKPSSSKAVDSPDVAVEPKPKRSYTKSRLSMPKKRHKQDAEAIQTFTVTALDHPSSSRERIEEQLQTRQEQEQRSEREVDLQPQPQMREEEREMQPEMGADLQSLVDSTSAQPLVETSIYKDVVWSEPMEINLVFDNSSIVKETVDEDDQAFHEVTSATHGANLETIAEESPYSAVVLNPKSDENISGEQIKEEDKITVAEFIAFNLIALLPSCWCVDTINLHTVRMSCLSPFENVSVQKSVIWNGQELKIFVHNRPLPKSNFIWNAAVIEDNENFGEVCDVLLHLATMLQVVKVCAGITVHESQWKKAEEKGRGTCEQGIYEDYKCIRHTDCWLLATEYAKCGNCHHLQRSMKDQVRRASDESTKDKKKVNDRYLSLEQKDEKLDDLEQEKIKLQKKYKRIREKVKKLISSKSCNISTESSEDLARLFQEEYEHMTQVERIFWSEQLKALSCQRKNSRCMRWNPFIIKVALHIRMRTTSEGYKYIKNFVKLPSDRTLYDYTHAVAAKDGIQDAAIKELSAQTLEYEEEHLKYFNIEFDEMHVRSDIVINKRTGDIIGYAHLREVEKDLANIQAEISSTEFAPSLAKTVLVYLAQGVTNPLLGVVAIYPSRDLSACELFSRTWDVIYTMESSGMKVLCLICDGAAMNKKFFRMHPGVDPLGVGSEHVYATKNLAATEERNLFFMVDPPHLLKTLRNCLANSYSHKKSRKMWKNNEDISWVTIEKLYAISAKDKYSPHKLTRAHIKLTPFSCMKVLLATQTMSASVARELINQKDHTALDGCNTKELAKFLKIVNKGFDCFNGSGDIHGKRNKSNPLLLPYTTQDDPRFEWLKEKYLGYFQEWKEDIKNRKGNFSATAREKMCVSLQAFESLHITTHGFIGAVQFMLTEAKASSIDAKKFNQDKLEQYFGNLRQSAGGSRSLNVAEVVNTANNLRVQSNAAQPPSRGNITVEQQEWIPDERPLERRKRT